MSNIFVLVKKSRVTVGHNETDDIVSLASKSYWGFEPLPAFTSEAAANKYIVDNKIHCSVQKLELQS